MYDCYHLCANKHQIEEMKVKAHQVIWGRRGTGKTTLLKAFVHNINYLQQDPSTVAIYLGFILRITLSGVPIASLISDTGAAKISTGFSTGSAN